MKNKDKFCDEFDKLNKELDGNDDMSDTDSINIEEIENSIMNKLETMIDNKLKPNNPTLESTPETTPELTPESTELNNEEDTTNED